MSDTTVTTTPPAGSSSPSSASSAPAPSHEVAIDTNPTQLPNPMSSTGPQAPVGDIKGSPHRPPSRREAIQAAFERASQPQQARPKAEPRPTPKPAEAKPGHNQPPEETPRLNLKKRPDDQQPVPRGEGGRFAPRPKATVGEPTTNVSESANAQPPASPVAGGQNVRQLPPNAPYREPLPRMSQQALAEWHATPEAVRADMHRIGREFVTAYNTFKADHEAMNPIRRFHQMAQQHGTTLERALINYVSMEQKLRSDPVAGLDLIVNNLNLKTADGQKITLRDIAHHVLTQSPEQLRLTQQGNNQQAAAYQIGALHQDVTALKNAVQQMYNQQQFSFNRSTVDKFAESHPRLDELADLIENEVKLGFDLETAYRRADLLRPSTTHAAQTRNTSAQTRTPDRSISGVPAGSVANGAARHDGPALGRREAITKAFKQAGARL